jgi:hypothetical protein
MRVHPTLQARASASLTAEVASFYDKSETRKKSVRRFVGTRIKRL